MNKTRANQESSFCICTRVTAKLLTDLLLYIFFFTKTDKVTAALRRKRKANTEQALEQQDRQNTADVCLFAFGDFALMHSK